MAISPYAAVKGNGRMLSGIVVGLLIGCVSSIATLVTLVPYFRTAVPSNGMTLTALVTHILGFPAFWFGGPWLTTKVLQSLTFADFGQQYIVCLGISYLGVIAYPTFCWVLWLGKTMGKDDN
jgi:hypothetical protein